MLKAAFNIFVENRYKSHATCCCVASVESRLYSYYLAYLTDLPEFHISRHIPRYKHKIWLDRLVWRPEGFGLNKISGQTCLTVQLRHQPSDTSDWLAWIWPVRHVCWCKCTKLSDYHYHTPSTTISHPLLYLFTTTPYTTVPTGLSDTLKRVGYSLNEASDINVRNVWIVK